MGRLADSFAGDVETRIRERGRHAGDADLADRLLARAINAAYGGAVQMPTPPRNYLLPLVPYRRSSWP